MNLNMDVSSPFMSISDSGSATARTGEEVASKNSNLLNPSQRNFLAFPAEILEIIFILYARDYHIEYFGYLTLTLPVWVNVSYVCRRWRYVALSCPLLWAYLFVAPLRWTEELFARSKQAPLKLNLTFDSQESPFYRRISHLLTHVRHHAERIQELHLQLPLVYVDRDIPSSSFPLRIPRLKNLIISAHKDIPYTLSVPIHNHTPDLRMLQVSYCTARWTSLTLNGLTTLSIHHIPLISQQHIMEILDILRSTPYLEHLYLDRAVSGIATRSLSSATFRTFQKFGLPHLSHLLVAAPHATILGLLSCVDIPLSTNIRLEGLSTGCGFSPLRKVYSLLASLLAQRGRSENDQALYTSTIRSLGIAIQRENRATLTFTGATRDSGALTSDWPAEWGCDVPLQISMDFGDKVKLSQCEWLTKDFCAAMQLANIETIHVLHPPFSPKFWVYGLGHARKVRHLKLSQGKMPDLGTLLSLSRQSSGDGGLDWRFAPVLEELELHDVVVSQPPVHDSNAESDVGFLHDVLSVRTQASGCRLTISHASSREASSGDREVNAVCRWEAVSKSM